jgi:hypothetical protein
MNPIAQNLQATIKLRKPNKLIRPVIDWKNAPAYGLAKNLTNTLHSYLPLPYTYNIHNCIQLISDLKTIELNKNIQICSFDKENVYTNVPKHDTINIISNILKDNPQNNENIHKDILYITQTIMEQTYLQFNQQYYEQTNGVAMGATTYVTHSNIPNLVKQQTIG